MRVAGVGITLAGAFGAIAVPWRGLPEAFGLLLVAALVLWLLGTCSAAACVAPARPRAAAGALAAAVLGWLMLFDYARAPLWGLAAAACGVVVAGLRTSRRLRTTDP